MDTSLEVEEEPSIAEVELGEVSCSREKLEDVVIDDLNERGAEAGERGEEAGDVEPDLRARIERIRDRADKALQAALSAATAAFTAQWIL